VLKCFVFYDHILGMDESKGVALTSISVSRFVDVDKERRLQIEALGRMLEGIFRRCQKACQ
jgi:hypothetical protein